MGWYQKPDGSLSSTGGPGFTWRGDIPDLGGGLPNNQASYTPPASPNAPLLNYNSNQATGSSTGPSYEFEWWHLLLFPPTWPFFLAGGALWLAYVTLTASACFVWRYRKVFSVISFILAAVAFVWSTVHVRGLADYEHGYPLNASTSAKSSMPLAGHPGRQSIDVYNDDNFGSDLTRAFCNLVGASHQYVFSSPSVDNHARLENERIAGWTFFKVNGGSVKNSTIIVRNGEIVIVGSVTHSTLKAQKIIVKGRISPDSTLILLKPDRNGWGR